MSCCAAQSAVPGLRQRSCLLDSVQAYRYCGRPRCRKLQSPVFLDASPKPKGSQSGRDTPCTHRSAGHGVEAEPAPFCISRRSCGLALVSAVLAQQVLPEATAVLQEVSTSAKFKPGQKQVLAINRRVQTQNNAPLGFPNFVRDGYEIVILADGYQENQDGLIWRDYQEGTGELPEDGQQVTFDYTAYNESGARIDSSYQKGRPAQTRLGIKGLIPGFEQGIKTMKVGGKRRLVVTPALGPPVGPSTFFSAKQCEVFDVELLDIKSCRRRQVAFFSDVVCE